MILLAIMLMVLGFSSGRTASFLYRSPVTARVGAVISPPVASHDFITFAADNGSIISGESYVTDRIDNIFSRDLLHILQCDTPMIRECAHCKQLYFSNNNKSRYCDTCKQHQNDIRQQKRKNNPCRYLHKQITDILNNNYDGSEEFRKESNYYWSVVQGKTPSKTSNAYDKHITTERAYLKWLQEKHNQYLKHPKNPPAN